MNDSEEKRLFQESIENVRKTVNSELYSRQDIEDKIRILSSPKPSNGKELSRWHRTQQRFVTVQFQTSLILYLRGKNENANKRVVALENLYDAIRKVHIDQNHSGRTGFYKKNLVRAAWSDRKDLSAFRFSLQDMSTQEIEEVH